MALCSLLIESLQCYRYGLPTTHKPEYARLLTDFTPAHDYRIDPAEHRSGLKTFEDFFARDIHRALFPDVDGKVFYFAIRNGLLHQAQTKDGWRIRSNEPQLWNEATKVVDRTRFANSLEEAFEKYVEELRIAAWDDDLWVKARRKIWWLIKLSS
jgi:fido (protein-threonine AMPylation protein)